MTKAADYRDKTLEELESYLIELQQKIFELKDAFAMTKRHAKPHLCKSLRRDKARIITIIAEKRESEAAHSQRGNS